MKRRYHINVFYRAEDRCYIADVPDLKYCSAHGATPAEALSEVLVAQSAWIEAAKASRKAVPRPAYRPAIYALD